MALTPSQRVKILKAISNRLSSEEWPEIDLVLKQFKLRTEEYWNGDKPQYVISMMEEAPDSTLNGIADHLELTVADPSTPSVLMPSFWKPGMLRLFVSHLAAHKRFVGELQESLLRYGISAFVAHNDIEPTSEWQTEIEKALSTCDSLVALLHPEFHLSNWTDQEIGFAMGRGAPVVAVRLGQDPYGFIGRFQACNGLGKSASALALDLFDVYRKHKQTKDIMSDVLVNLLEKSGSFESAKIRTGYLEELDHWKDGFAERIRAAILTNSQVGHSWGVPERLEALIAQREPTKRGFAAAIADDDLPF